MIITRTTIPARNKVRVAADLVAGGCGNAISTLLVLGGSLVAFCLMTSDRAGCGGGTTVSSVDSIAGRFNASTVSSLSFSVSTFASGAVAAAVAIKPGATVCAYRLLARRITLANSPLAIRSLASMISGGIWIDGVDVALFGG